MMIKNCISIFVLFALVGNMVFSAFHLFKNKQIWDLKVQRFLASNDLNNHMFEDLLSSEYIIDSYSSHFKSLHNLTPAYIFNQHDGRLDMALFSSVKHFDQMPAHIEIFSKGTREIGEMDLRFDLGKKNQISSYLSREKLSLERKVLNNSSMPTAMPYQLIGAKLSFEVKSDKDYSGKMRLRKFFRINKQNFNSNITDEIDFHSTTGNNFITVDYLSPILEGKIQSLVQVNFHHGILEENGNLADHSYFTLSANKEKKRIYSFSYYPNSNRIVFDGVDISLNVNRMIDKFKLATIIYTE